MKVPIEIERTLNVEEVPPVRAQALLDDLEGTIRLFPKLRRLEPLGPNSYLWKMDPIGAAGIEHEVVYAAEYDVQPADGAVRFKPIIGHGNATIMGHLRVEPGDVGTRLSFRVQGTLYEVPVPMVYRLAAPPVIQGIFKRLVERYLEKLRDTLGD